MRNTGHMILVLALACCVIGVWGPWAAAASGGDGVLLAQGPPPGAPPGGGPGGGAGNNPCVQSHQRCVALCAGNGTCVNNCNMGFAACMQQQQGGRPGGPPGRPPGGPGGS